MIQVKTYNQIRKLRFEVPDYNVVEWFEVHEYGTGVLIKSGLRHADGETKTPYYYEDFTCGRGHKKFALEKFNRFLISVTGFKFGV